MREVAGGARRVCGVSSVKKNHDTLVVCRMQKCACAVQCVVRVSCGEQFTRHMFGADADRAVGSQSCAVERVCESRWCALSHGGWRWRACDLCRGKSSRNLPFVCSPIYGPPSMGPHPLKTHVSWIPCHVIAVGINKSVTACVSVGPGAGGRAGRALLLFTDHTPRAPQTIK